MNPGDVKALLFDVFGTVVDWRGSIVREGERDWTPRGLRVDWPRFVDAWRGHYHPSLERVNRGELPWATVDELNRLALDATLEEFSIPPETLSETGRDELNRAWHRLDPWPDSVPGLMRLKRRYIIGTLSNGNMSLLVNMAKHAGLAWDCVLSAELARAYKPDPRAYLTAVELLDLRPGEVMMIAAHAYDLHAARNVGLRTAFVSRPLEFGPQANPDLTPDLTFDVVADDLEDLAQKLDA